MSESPYLLADKAFFAGAAGMAGRSRDVTDEVRRRVGILEVVAPHVTLRRAGRSYKGLCPFHSEKTPSFTVDPEKGFFYCFGCHAGGDVFDFVMRIGSASFGDALKELAERAGVQLERTAADEQRAGERERWLRAAAEAATFFRAQLAGVQGAAARKYLAGRGVTAEIQEGFGIGYAPHAWDALIRAMHARGFEAAALEEVGLAVPRTGGGGYYDALRDRITFPIRDMQGRPVAFGGRALADGSPKYLNTRETPLFAKGKMLYALDAARAAIRETGEAVVVEGYMDAIACHQFGVRGAVASLGTALTLDQVLLLKRFATRAVLVYDADAAGADAAERGLGIFEQAELPVRVAVLPGDADPDAFLRKEGAEAFRRVLASALPVFDYRVAMATRRHDPKTVEGKVGIVDEVSQLIILVPNPVRQAEYVRLLGERLGVREDAIRSQLRRVGRARDETPRSMPVGAVSAVEVRPVQEATARATAERLLLHLMIADASSREAMQGIIGPEEFREAGHRELAAALLAPETRGTEPGRLRERLRDETAVSLLSRFLIAEPPVAGDPRKVAEGCVQQIRRWALQERIDRLREAYGEADRAKDQARRDALGVELNEAYSEKRMGELKVSG
jgi:DNA primase